VRKSIALWVFMLALATPLVAQDYNIFRFPEGYDGAAINSSGEVVGGLLGAGFVWTRSGGYLYLGGGNVSVSDSGDVAGDAGGSAFLWTPSGGIQFPESPLGGETSAFAVNNAGQIAGLSFAANDHYTYHVFFWSPSTGSVDVGTLAGSNDSVAAGFNNSGEIIGWSGGLAFRWTLSTGIQALSGSPNFAEAINDSGQIAGFATSPLGAVLWSPGGGIQSLGTLPGDITSDAKFINAAGHVTGVSTHYSGKRPIDRIFFWTPEAGMIDTGAPPGIYLLGLNNRDQILLSTIKPQATYLWSPSLGLREISTSLATYLEPKEFNDAGAFLALQDRSGVVASPIMHVSVSSSQSPSQAGQPVTFTVNVSALVGLPPDGDQITLLDGATVLGSKIIGTGVLSNGTVRFTTSTLRVGTHDIFAEYAGDGNYFPNTSGILQQVVKP